MRSGKPQKKRRPRKGPKGISGISVQGYKSISNAESIELRPLTILAGANSSGKSSIMQPLLLLKQTLEASFDPGPLLLTGPNLKFTSAKQFLSKGGEKASFSTGVTLVGGASVTVAFATKPGGGLEIVEMLYVEDGKESRLSPHMPHDEVLRALPSGLVDMYRTIGQLEDGIEWTVRRDRCFLEVAMRRADEGQPLFLVTSPASAIEQYVRAVIHLPGLRGNPERTYPVTAVSGMYPGTFDKYAASVIAKWERERNSSKLAALREDLERLGLTWKVTAKAIDDTQVELRVGRLPHPKRGGGDLVSIADVGFGVSQTLPVLVALHAAVPGQLVYLEQPEIHLHPRAQCELAASLAAAAKRGVRLVVETHSSLLLLAVQALVAEGDLPSETVMLHWFQRGADGVTAVRSADLDETGAFGDWPEDFGDVALAVESRYLDAAEERGSKE